MMHSELLLLFAVMVSSIVYRKPFEIALVFCT